MSENEGVAAPAATTEAPASVVEAPKPVGGTTAGAVKQSGRAAAMAIAEKHANAAQAARDHHSTAQPRNEVGQFAGPPAAEAAEPTQVLGGSATAEATATTQATQGPPEGMVRIEYPEGHPLRDQGETHIDVPAASERSVRAMVNAVTRRRDSEQAERRAQEAEAARMRAEATLEWYRQHGNSYWTPEDQALYDDIVASYSPTLGAEGAKARAEAFKRGREADAKAQMGQVAEQADMQAVTQHWQSEGEVFKTEALRHLPEQFPGVTSAEIQQAITIYALELQRVQDSAWSKARHQMSRPEFERRFAREFGYSEKDFIAVAGDYLKTRPGVIAAAGQASAAQQIRENQIRAEAEAAQQAKLREASQRHATNPQRALGGVPSGARTTDTTPEQPDRTKMTAGEVKRTGRDHARALGQALDRALGR